MKKLFFLLSLSFLLTQASAYECSKESENKFLNDSDLEYIARDVDTDVYAYKSTVRRYENSNLVLWSLMKNKTSKKYAFSKLKIEFNINTDLLRLQSTRQYDCNGNIVGSDIGASSYSEWVDIPPRGIADFLRQWTKLQFGL